MKSIGFNLSLCYHGFQFYADSDVTLEDDIIRRDLTINALAEDEHGNIIDYVNGQADIENRVLRHVSSAFAELCQHRQPILPDSKYGQDRIGKDK